MDKDFGQVDEETGNPNCQQTYETVLSFISNQEKCMLKPQWETL